MKITFNMEGFDRLRTQVETLSSDSEIAALNKRIYQRSADVTEPRMKAHMPRSADNSKSGRNGYRPPGHAADNIEESHVTERRSRVEAGRRCAELVLHEVRGMGHVKDARARLHRKHDARIRIGLQPDRGRRVPAGAERKAGRMNEWTSSKRQRMR